MFLTVFAASATASPAAASQPFSESPIISITFKTDITSPFQWQSIKEVLGLPYQFPQASPPRLSSLSVRWLKSSLSLNKNDRRPHRRQRYVLDGCGGKICSRTYLQGAKESRLIDFGPTILRCAASAFNDTERLVRERDGSCPKCLLQGSESPSPTGRRMSRKCQ